MDLRRRSRMYRTRKGKHIELSKRDIEIFRVLARYRYLSSRFIYSFVGGKSETRFTERLGDLFHEGYLDRPARQWDMANCRHRPVIHELGAGAKRVLQEQGIAEAPRTWLDTSAHRQFLHSMMICEILASIEFGTRMHFGLRFIAWPEILAKAPEGTRALAAPYRFPATTSTTAIVPDGLFGIEYTAGEKKTYRFFALEADRGTMPMLRSDQRQTSYLGKLATYGQIISELIYKSHLRIPNLLILTVTTSDQRLNELMARLEVPAGSVAIFLFKAIVAAGLTSPAPRLLSEPWQRARLPLQRIDQ